MTGHSSRLLALKALALVTACTAAFADQKVRLTVRSPSGLRAPRWPVTTGVPFPKGALGSADHVGLIDAAGKPVPIQTRAAGTWGPKGSVRWLLLDFQASLDGKAATSYRLRFSQAAPSRKSRSRVSIRELGPSVWEVNTGPLAFTVRRDRFDFIRQAWAVRDGKRVPLFRPSDAGGSYMVDGDGTTYRAADGPADEVIVEERGPLRCVICAKGWHYAKSGRKYCRYIVRLHAFAGLPFVKVLYTFIVTKDSDRARFRDIGLHVPVRLTEASFGGDRARGHPVSDGESVYLLQYDSDKFVVRRGAEPRQWDESPPSKRAAGWARAASPGAAMTVAVRDFWQQFPKELEAVGGRGLTFHAWPSHGVAKPNRPVTDAVLQYLWFCHEGEVLNFKVPEAYYSHKGEHSEREYRYVRSAKRANVIGLAKTHEMLLWFHSPSESETVAKTVEAWQEEPVCMADPKWMCASGVFGRLHPRDPERFPKIEEGLSRAFDCERRLERHTKDYGMFNFGDGHTTWDMKRKRWSDAYRCWRALHHGAPRVPWLLYARSGDPKYYRHAVRNARHVMDIDICHHTTPELEKLEYPLGKIVGALNDYKGLVHWHSGNRLFDYNSMTDFMLYHYYLTGDRRGLEVALEWGESIKQRFRKPRGRRSGAGVTAGLIELYQATWDPEHKRIIDLYVSHMFDKVQNMDGAGVYSSHVIHYWPEKKGKKIPVGAFPEWENYAPWIQRYYDMTGDKRTGERIVAWADAYRAGFGDLCSLWGANEYVNIMAYAYFVSGDTKYLSHGLYRVNSFIDSIEHSPGTLYDGFPHKGQMSHGPGYMAQRIPYFLAALAAAGKPIAMELPPPRPFDLLFTRRRPEGKKFEYVNLLLREEKDAAFRILAKGSMGYDKRPVHVLVKAPSGREIVKRDIEFVKGPIDLDVSVPADDETGTYRVTIRGEGSYWRIKSPIRTEPELRQVYPFEGTYVRFPRCRYYFLVPKGTRSFSMTVRVPNPERRAFSVYDPAGAQVADVSVPPTQDSPPHTVRFVPVAEQTGKLWLIEGRAGTVTVKFEAEGAEIPRYFATELGLFFIP